MTIHEEMRLVTFGLTGRREADISYLEKKLEEYAADHGVAAGIRRILGALCLQHSNAEKSLYAV